MNLEFEVVLLMDADGYYVASVPALPTVHTQARSLRGLKARVKEAIELCLEAGEGPTETLEFVGIQRIRLVTLASKQHDRIRQSLAQLKAGKERRTSADKLIKALDLDA